MLNSIQMQALLNDLCDLCDKHKVYINFLNEPVYNFSDEKVCFINTKISNDETKYEYELRKSPLSPKFN